MTVALSLLGGACVEHLVARATDAQLLAVGAPSPGLTERLRPDSAALGAAGQAACPVVVVPAEQPAVGQLRRIVVGLKSPSRADDELLWSAFAEARRHGAELAVVHAWQPGTPYPDVVAGARHDPRWLPGEAALVEERLTGLRHAFPGVQLRVDVVRGSAADALVAASAEGSVVMLARSRVRGPARCPRADRARRPAARPLPRGARARLADPHRGPAAHPGRARPPLRSSPGRPGTTRAVAASGHAHRRARNRDHGGRHGPFARS